MSITVRLYYMDDKEYTVEISESELDRFSDHISSHKIYWNQYITKGFWTDISKVRYINFLRHSAEEGHEQRESISADCQEVSSEA